MVGLRLLLTLTLCLTDSWHHCDRCDTQCDGQCRGNAFKRRRVDRRDENVYCVMCEDLGCSVCHTVCESVRHSDGCCRETLAGCRERHKGENDENVPAMRMYSQLQRGQQGECIKKARGTYLLDWVVGQRRCVAGQGGAMGLLQTFYVFATKTPS